MSLRFLLPLVILASSCATQPTLSYNPKETVRQSTSSTSTSAQHYASHIEFEPSADELVQNGTAYHCTNLELPEEVHEVRVPKFMVVKYHGEPGTMRIYLAKIMGYMGHPTRRMSITTAQDHMGLAIKTNGFRIEFSTFGGWGSIEGGQEVGSALIVPPGTYVTRSDSAGSPSLEIAISEGWSVMQCRPDFSHGFKRFAPAD
jgi:hypothetical protein